MKKGNRLETLIESSLILLTLIPFIYLLAIWKSLPEKVPMHWNIRGEIDRWGNKQELILIPVLLPLLTYIILSLVPLIDPKKNIRKMGNKYLQLKFYLTAFMSGLAIYILYLAKTTATGNFNLLFPMIGLLIMILGNYFKTIKPNYFIGIRTPWTLEHESVWKDTHDLGGKLWFTGGILIIFLSFVLKRTHFMPVFLIILAVITLIPVIYSYYQARRL